MLLLCSVIPHVSDALHDLLHTLHRADTQTLLILLQMFLTFDSSLSSFGLSSVPLPLDSMYELKILIINNILTYLLFVISTHVINEIYKFMI